ncbi:hypothetical protein GCM10009759_07210 [Kitasatospora saccharophila]|uniref:Uncharacterized protein n=1 Tax=Kitasatospora saccharophila TaxID=407973 RepID=A0ABN2W937_9ACTN
MLEQELGTEPEHRSPTAAERASRIRDGLCELTGREPLVERTIDDGFRITLRVVEQPDAVLAEAVLRILKEGDSFGHSNKNRWDRFWAEVDASWTDGDPVEETESPLTPVEYYPDGRLGLDWRAVSDDLDGVVLAQSYDGVAIARATDRRTVLVVNPDEWADLRDAIKRGRCDHLLGDRLLCAEPGPGKGFVATA